MRQLQARQTQNSRGDAEQTDLADAWPWCRTCVAFSSVLATMANSTLAHLSTGFHLLGTTRRRHRHGASVLHLDTIVRAVHLIGVYGANFLPKGLSPTQSLDIFRSYYVNKYIDHHSFETVF